MFFKAKTYHSSDSATSSITKISNLKSQDSSSYEPSSVENIPFKNKRKAKEITNKAKAANMKKQVTEEGIFSKN